MKSHVLSLMIAVALVSGSALASEPAKAPKPATAEQQAAKAEIERLVERIKVLSKDLGDGSDVRVIVRSEKHDGPGWKERGPEHERMMERMGPGGPGGDERQIVIERGPGGPGGPGGPEAFKRGPGLGIVMAPNPAAAGVRIAAVSPDSPAQKAGLRSGDALLAINGKTISGSGAPAVESARELLGDLKQGQVVKLRYAREGKTFDASVKADEIRRVFAFNREERMPGMPGMHDGDGQQHKRMMMLPPGVEMDIERMGPMRDCPKGDEDCGLPAIYQAFRWQGLNLSSIDPGLGRYFGTDKGVLVLSSGPELKGLQSGDVIQRVAGAAVESPRDVMRALREGKSGSQLKMDVLRDRKTTAVTITVPKSRPLPFMAPTPPPAAPRAGGAMRAPAARAGDVDDQVSEYRSMDEDGNERVEVVVAVPAVAPVAPAR